MRYGALGKGGEGRRGGMQAQLLRALVRARSWNAPSKRQQIAHPPLLPPLPPPPPSDVPSGSCAGGRWRPDRAVRDHGMGPGAPTIGSAYSDCPMVVFGRRPKPSPKKLWGGANPKSDGTSTTCDHGVPVPQSEAPQRLRGPKWSLGRWAREARMGSDAAATAGGQFLSAESRREPQAISRAMGPASSANQARIGFIFYCAALLLPFDSSAV